MSEENSFEFEKWLRSLFELIFWTLMLLPLIVFPIFFIILPPIFDAAGIRLGQADSVQAINVFFTALIDPIKGMEHGELIAKEAALPLGLPFILLNVVLIGIFLWENETDKVTISRYPYKNK